MTATETLCETLEWIQDRAQQFDIPMSAAIAMAVTLLRTATGNCETAALAPPPPAPSHAPMPQASMSAEEVAAHADIRSGKRARWIAENYEFSLFDAQTLCAEVDAERRDAI